MKKLAFFIMLLCGMQIVSAAKPRTIFGRLIKAIGKSMVRSNNGVKEEYKISDIKFQQRHVGAHDGFFVDPNHKH